MRYPAPPRRTLGLVVAVGVGVVSVALAYVRVRGYVI